MQIVRSVAVVTSIHPDFDARIWKHVGSLADNGITVHFICPWEVTASTIIPNCFIHPFSRVVNRLYRPVLIPIKIFKILIPILRQVQIIHFHDIDLLPWMALLSLFKPVVYDVHENYSEEMMVRDWIPKPLRRSLKHLIEFMHILFPFFIRNIVLVVPQQKLEFTSCRLNLLMMYNYASLKLLDGFCHNYSSRPNRIIFTGGHYEENGTSLIIEIAKRLKNRGINVEIWVTDRFASKQYEVVCKQEIIDFKLNNIKVIDSVPSSDIMQLLNQVTIGIAPNLRVQKQELAIPTKLFEYMAASLPIISSDLPYQQDLITRHNNGLLASPEDPDSFVVAIEKLVKDRALAERLGRNGQSAFKENYVWESQIPALISFYKKILKTKLEL